MMITFADLSESVPDTERPLLDRAQTPTTMTPDQQFWREHGYLIKERFLPEDLIDRYCRVYEKSGPWLHGTPYLEVPEMRELCIFPPLRALLGELIGEPMGLSLNLSAWFSSERNWHQDDYLNPPYINCWYAAVWMALDDIHPDMGPFEFVPGSHKWPLLRRDRVLAHAEPGEEKGMWPKTTERFVVPAIERHIAETGATVLRFLGKKGDILIWHAALMHRGSEPARSGLVRKALIAHYGGVSHFHTAQGIREYLPEGYFVPPGWRPATGP
jgi:hypothetical protein